LASCKWLEQLQNVLDAVLLFSPDLDCEGAIRLAPKAWYD
jgi:hypothetical protein